MGDWYLIDDRTSSRSSCFDEKLAAKDRDEAIAYAELQWSRLSKRDQTDCDAFFVGYADTDEYGCVDLDTIVDIYEIKSYKKL